MKKIGFVYKYNPSEEKGILVFGTWKVKSTWNTTIIFSVSDLLSEVTSGCLVYFDINDNKAYNIERASLSNFKIDYINSLIRCGEHESEFFFYRENTIISFENLKNIIIPEKKQVEEIKKDTSNKKTKRLRFINIFNEQVSASLVPQEFNVNLIKDTTKELPETIENLFNCFGKYKHNGNDRITLDVFDLSLWVDQDILNDKYYGMNIEELKLLYDLFVMRKHYDKEGNEINFKPENDVISSKWSLLLSKFGENDLKSIMDFAPKLQPAFPKNFCKKNAGILTDDYGMPDVEICKLYCLHKISNATTVSEYNNIKHKLFVYSHCRTKHLEGEGVPMCQMGKRRINNLVKCLEDQYENVIKQNVISQFKILSENANVVNEIQNITPGEINNIGLFIDKYNEMKNDFLYYEVCKDVLDSYDKLPLIYKDALKTSLLNCANESAISATKADDLIPCFIYYNVKQLGNWILASTKQKIKELVNDRFSNLDDLEDLNDAYKYDYITSKQYFNKYKKLTSNYNTYQFLKELSDYRIEDSPLTIQWYVVSNIINQLGYDSINSYKYINFNYYDAITDIRSLLKWLNSYGHLKDIVLKKAENKICSVLSDNERWTLFEENIVKSPGFANIRKRLNKAYKKKYINKELMKHVCFQDVMLSDMDTVKDSEVIIFIADNLDSRHQYLMQQKATGFMKLYLWQKQPSSSFDWTLVKSHFCELPVDAQIRTLRYIFGLMASGKTMLTLDDLYSEFVETLSPASPSICGILFMLKTKKNDMKMRITSGMLEPIIGEDIKQIIKFLKDSKKLFYSCNGYLAITNNQQDIKYQSFNGILTKEVNNDLLYYVITFHYSPVNLFGETIEWSNSEYVKIAKQVLVRNTDVEIVNGKYYVPESQEFFVRQFVVTYDIDDKCGLISDKERMIELGYLPKNNAYQPLYTNCLRKYEDSDNYICRCGCIGGSDPNNHYPFFWCKKKICARRAHFLLPPTQWEYFRFADFLFIALGQTSDVRASVWCVNSEISNFLCDYAQYFKSNKIYFERHFFDFGKSKDYKSSDINISSSPLNDSEEMGTWDKESSTYRDIYDDDDYDYHDDDYDYHDDDYDYHDDDYDYHDDDYHDYSPDYDEPTYDRYNGSYAQDYMGYSDDDIDTIFDGEPDAYWNID